MDNYTHPPLIENSYIDIHNKPDTNIPFCVFDNPNDLFGVLNIKIGSVEITSSPVFILLTIDKSGSMFESVVTNHFDEKPINKIDYVINTCKNAVKYLSMQNAEIYLAIHTFNNEISILLEETRITPDNANNICGLFDKIDCTNITNIGLAMNTAEQTMQKYLQKNPTHKIMNLFMTDGEPTAGIREKELLNSIINTKFNNIFIGYGKDHNSWLLKKFAENKKTEYHFVDNFENTGLVYCDAIYKVLFPAIEEIKITVENGEIYDWKTGKWTTFIEEDVWISDVQKLYHIKTTNPTDVTANICGIVTRDNNVSTLIDTVYVLPVLIDTRGGYINEYTDLSKYMFRQKVQEILFKLASKQNPDKINNYREEKIKLRTFFGNMHKWMRENNYKTDPFMLLLCQDIEVVYKSLNKGKSMMYISARQTSQGTQQSYTACSIQRDSDDDEEEIMQHPLSLPPNPLSLPPNIFRFQSHEVNPPTDILQAEDIDREDDINYYRLSSVNQKTTCYATPRFVETARYFTK
jgi:hypothetical protein